MTPHSPPSQPQTAEHSAGGLARVESVNGRTHMPADEFRVLLLEVLLCLFAAVEERRSVVLDARALSRRRQGGSARDERGGECSRPRGGHERRWEGARARTQGGERGRARRHLAVCFARRQSVECGGACGEGRRGGSGATSPWPPPPHVVSAQSGSHVFSSGRRRHRSTTDPLALLSYAKAPSPGPREVTANRKWPSTTLTSRRLRRSHGEQTASAAQPHLRLAVANESDRLLPLAPYDHVV